MYILKSLKFYFLNLYYYNKIFYIAILFYKKFIKKLK